MMKIKITDRLDLKRKITQIRRVAEGRGAMQILADYASERIFIRTKQGKGVNRNNGPEGKFAELSESYIEQRKGNLTFRTNKQGKVYPIEKISNKDLKSLRASKGARKQNRKNRDFLKKNKPFLDKTTSPKRSNLTQSGRMLSSIKGFFIGMGKAQVRITGQRNIKLAKIHQTEGVGPKKTKRPFFYISANDRKVIVKRYRASIISKLTRLFSKN